MNAYGPSCVKPAVPIGGNPTISPEGESLHHICVCISTYQRPLLLERLLKKLKDLRTDRIFSYSIIVVDNDAQGSGRDVVLRLKSEVPLTIDYYIECERNISLARNLLVQHAQGQMIAFIDDDEFPDDEWLLLLYRSLSHSGADAVLGPVLPHFDIPPPKWLLRSGILERKRFKTNTIITDSRNTRTGNVLAWSGFFKAIENPFDPAYGKTGGGDAVFFRNRIRDGKVVIWCDEAVVYETVPVERQLVTYYLKRALTRGMTTAWNTRLLSFQTMTSILAVLVYALLLPFSLVLGYHLCVALMVKGCDHLSKLISLAGIRMRMERPY